MKKETLSTLNTRTGVKKQKKNDFAFSYWAGELPFEEHDTDGSGDVTDRHLDTILHLAALRRGAANFVNILTGRNDIPVHFSSGKQSYTSGNEVVISADTNPKKFDATVGTALHEAAHCLLTDFPLINFAFVNASTHFFSNHVLRNSHLSDLHLIFNAIEDRRIDAYVYRTAHGYRPYYDSMYANFWNSKHITAALYFKWTEPTWENYINRIINISNPAAQETAHMLPGLQDIYDMIDLPHISRLDHDVSYRNCITKHVFSKKQRHGEPDMYKIPLSYYYNSFRGDRILDQYVPNIIKLVSNIAERIIRECNIASNSTSSSKSTSSNQKPNTNSAEKTAADDSANIGSELPNLDVNSYLPDSEKKTKKKKKDKPAPKPNEKKIKQDLKKQKDFLNGKLKKKKIDKKLAKEVAAMESAGANVKPIGNAKLGRGRVLVTTKLNEEILASSWWEFSSKTYNGAVVKQKYLQNAIQDGARMGQILVHRLQIRNEQTVTTYPNQTAGRINRRVLSRLGMDMDNVFSRLQKDQYNPTLIHISLDASASMNNYEKWVNSLKVAAALTYASYKINNLDVVVSIRGQAGNDQRMAHMAICHDTRVSPFATFKRNFQYIVPSGSTPEGLCFEAIMDTILADANEYQMYFVNISDGQPTFTCNPLGTQRTVRRRRGRWSAAVGPISSYKLPPGVEPIVYRGPVAWQHTRQQVNIMKESGINILSYYVEEKKNKDHYRDAFHAMYGEHAEFIDVTQITSIANTMNKLLLKRQ